MLGRVSNNLGRPRLAIPALEEALALRADGGLGTPMERAAILDALAIALVARPDLERAEALLREAVEITRAEVGEEDPRYSARLEGLGKVLSQAGRHREARDLLRRGIEHTLRRLGLADVESVAQRRVDGPDVVALANALAGLATEERKLGEAEAAERHLRQSVALHRRQMGDTHFVVAFGRNNLANVLSTLGRSEEAVAERAAALSVAEAALGTAHPSVASMQLNQASDLADLGRWEEAEPLVAAGLETIRSVLGSEHPASASALEIAGAVAARAGRIEEALDLQQAALELREKVLPEGHPDRASSRASVGGALRALGRLDEAREELERAVELSVAALGEEHPETVERRRALAGVLPGSGGPTDSP